MRKAGAPKSIRIATGIMAIMMLLVVLFSAFYLAAESGHDCSGEDCPICEIIQSCENTLQHMGSGLPYTLSVILPFVTLLCSIILTAALLSRSTPVSRKIRLNN